MIFHFSMKFMSANSTTPDEMPHSVAIQNGAILFVFGYVPTASIG